MLSSFIDFLSDNAWPIGGFIIALVVVVKVVEKFKKPAPPLKDAEHFPPRQEDVSEKLDPVKDAEIRELTERPIYLLVAILAKFAKLDGVITKKEISTVEEILREMDIVGEDRKEAIRIFSKHKSGVLTYEEVLLILFHISEDEIEVRSRVCLMLIGLAHSDGVPASKAVQWVRYACEVLRVNYHEVNDFFQQQRNIRNATINADFEILGCSPTDSNETIKKRYRELAKTFHPDTMSGKDLHPEITKLATEKLRTVQEAYERIMSQRGVS